MRVAIVCLVLVAALVASVSGEPVLEWAFTPAGPWEVDSDAIIRQLPSGNLEVWTPTEAESVGYRQRFYRLVDAQAELAHCPIGLVRAIRMEFVPGDLDRDGDGVPDCLDLCPGHDDRIDENGNNIPDACEIPDMARIPAGAFEMGDAFNEGETDERPVHTVTVSTFYIGRNEVTKALWDDVRAWALGHGYSFENAGDATGGTHPVHTVSWHDVVKWCNARSEMERLDPCYYTSGGDASVYRTGEVDLAAEWVRWNANGYRLPTEAEWERAARGGLVGQRYPWGDTIDKTRANYESGGTNTVGGYAPNGYGLYDMAGNLWEWCWDWYDTAWYGAAEASDLDPQGPSSSWGRVSRGGGWFDSPLGLRCADRTAAAPTDQSGAYGFRCARSRP